MLSFTHQHRDLKSAIVDWWPIFLGLLILYVPTFYDLANGMWSKEEQAHGPIILILSLWLMYRKWMEMINKSEGKSAAFFGWVVFFVALVLYVIGRSQQILVFEMSSFIWILAAVILIKRGYIALKVMWFPLFFFALYDSIAWSSGQLAYYAYEDGSFICS
ncbi:Transmembrane exosortase (Exosortase_EpsH) [Nitrosomonas oligotropha]|nr:Transmembrane exosortase (Exosortase_EpsH) [Nitrosomonas oligotropha]